MALNRVLNLPVLTLYGLGTIVGAGIYVLVGKVAGSAGLFTPYAFLLAGIIAAFTAFSYAELSTRFPQASGAALYVHQGLRLQPLAQLVGWLVVLTGIVSAATLANGFVGYMQVFVDTPRWLIIGVLVTLLTAIACWGIRESAVLIITITLAEIGGLLFVIWVGMGAEPVATWDSIVTAPPAGAMTGILLGGFLAFYAFVGFEDMVNVVEEVKQPRKTMPRAIIAALLLSAVLYVAVAVAAVRLMPPEQLAGSDKPLADMVSRAGMSDVGISLISLIAVINGALAQIIMASRVMYGMAQQKLAPAALGVVHDGRQTPLRATVLVGGVLLFFALALPLVTLAKITSFITLTVFALANIALVVIKCRSGRDAGAFNLPLFVPVVGAVLCVALMGAEILF